ncbi:MAG: hypothetical protein ACRD96_28220, partial [Bryobacteraceae bacterium]
MNASVAQSSPSAGSGALRTTLKWLAIGALVAFGAFSYVVSVGRFTEFNEPSYKNFWPHRGWLLAHILGG